MHEKLQSSSIVVLHKKQSTTVDLKTARKRRKGTYYNEQYSILGGEAKIYRTAVSGDVWQVVYYIPGENQAFRKSLRTRDIEIAKEKARSIVLDVMLRVNSGEKVFSRSFDDVVKLFIAEKRSQAQAGEISLGRVGSLASILTKAASEFVGAHRKIDSIRGDEWKRYFTWRRQQKPGIKDITLPGEASAIKQFYKYAIENRHTSLSNKPIFQKAGRTASGGAGRRSELSSIEVSKIRHFLDEYVELSRNGSERMDRLLFHSFIALSLNTGLRIGEMRFLRWENVTTFDHSEDGTAVFRACQIKVQPDTCKTRKFREVQGRQGEAFDKLAKLSRYTHPRDYVFADPSSGEPISKKKLYKMWSDTKEGAGLSEKEGVTLYSLRHTYATNRLLSGVEIYTLSLNMGCSVAFIEQHYGHVKTHQRLDELTRQSKRHPLAFRRAR
jgi:integrase